VCVFLSGFDWLEFEPNRTTHLSIHPSSKEHRIIPRCPHPHWLPSGDLVAMPSAECEPALRDHGQWPSSDKSTKKNESVHFVHHDYDLHFGISGLFGPLQMWGGIAFHHRQPRRTHRDQEQQKHFESKQIQFMSCLSVLQGNGGAHTQ